MLPHLVSRENGAKGHNVGNYLGIGAAADGFGIGRKSGLFGIDAQKRLNQGAVFRSIKAFFMYFFELCKS